MKNLPLIGLCTALIALILFLTTPYMALASAAYFCMIAGLLQRKKNRFLHRKLMVAATGLDILLVLSLEIQRNAVKTAMEFSLNPLQQAHVVCSLIAVVLYGFVIFYGYTLWHAGSVRARQLHKRLGIAAFVFRTLGFLLMFSLLGRAH